MAARPEGGTREVPGSGCGACGGSIHAGGPVDCGLPLAPNLDFFCNAVDFSEAIFFSITGAGAFDAQPAIKEASAK